VIRDVIYSLRSMTATEAAAAILEVALLALALIAAGLASRRGGRK